MYIHTGFFKRRIDMLNGGDIIFGIITSLIGISWIFMSREFPAGTADGGYQVQDIFLLFLELL